MGAMVGGLQSLAALDNGLGFNALSLNRSQLLCDNGQGTVLPSPPSCGRSCELSGGGIISELEEARCQEQWSPHLARVQGRTVTKEINHHKPETGLHEAAHAHSAADFD